MATKNFTMKDNNGAGWDILHPKTTIEQVEGLASKIDEVESIAKGASKGKTFDTVAALDAWLAVAANRETLNPGDNFYIIASDVPDYWWDGEQKQILETEKVVQEMASASNNGLMSKEDKSKLDEIESGATRVTSPSDIGAAESVHGHTTSDITDFPTSMPASDVSAWAKAGTKPTYTASEVGAATTEQGAKADSAYQKPGTGIPKTDLESGVQTSLDKADTALQSVPLATGSTDGLLSKDDFTKLSGVEANANKYTHPTGDGNLHVPVTSTTNNGKVLKAGATAGSVAWGDVSFADLTNKPTTVSGYGLTDAATTAIATTSANGLMSSTDKTKLDTLASNTPVVTVSATAPANPKVGDIWYDLNN